MERQTSEPNYEPASYDSVKNSLTLRCFTAVLPDCDDKLISGDEEGLTRWHPDARDVFWRLKIINSGQLNVAMNIGNEEATAGSEIEVEIEGQKISAATLYTCGPETSIPVNVGSVNISKPGVVTVAVRVKSAKEDSGGNLRSLQLSGPAAVGSEEERIPRDIAPTILQMKEGIQYEMVYTSVTPVVSYLGTHFVVCGLSGLGNLSLVDTDYEGDKSIQFGFGIEKCVFPWKLNETCHFLVRAVPQPDTKSMYVFAYCYNNEESSWQLVAMQQTDELDGIMQDPSSQICQSWGCQQGYFPREALFGPMWARVPGGQWEELSDARFVFCKYSHDNGDASVEDCRFRVRTGGDTKMNTPRGSVVSARKTGQIPDNLKDIENKLPEINFT